MVEIVRQSEFEKGVKHVKDSKLKERIKKQISKIIDDPERTGEFLRNKRKFEKKVYIPPFRLIFAYDKKKDIVYLIDFNKRDKVYRK